MDFSLKKIIAGILFACCFSVPNSQAISGEAAFCISAGFGALVGACGYAEFKGKSARPELKSVALGALFAVAMGLILNEYTPSCRVSRFLNIMARIEFDPFITMHFLSEIELENYCLTEYHSSWPLVLANMHMQALAADLHEAQALLHGIYEDTAYTAALRERIHGLDIAQKIIAMEAVLADRMGCISRNCRFSQQLNLYQMHVENGYQREHDSFERLMDRRAYNNQQCLNRQAEADRQNKEIAYKQNHDNKEYSYKNNKMHEHYKHKDKKLEFDERKDIRDNDLKKYGIDAAKQCGNVSAHISVS